MSKKKSKKSHVVLIEDPFGLPNLEIEEAQNSAEELPLDEDLPATELTDEEQADLKKLETALDAQTKSTIKELEAIEEMVTDLDAQIAEDQALEAAQKKEEAELQADALIKSSDIELTEVQSILESLLFISDKPLTRKRIIEICGEALTKETLEAAVDALKQNYEASHHGIELVEVAGGLQLRTKVVRADVVKKLARVVTHKLSRGGMETLALIAYKQPLMKEEVDQVRGVDSTYFIRGLLEKKLIKISGRSELPGRPMLYSTTSEFLEVFGLASLADLPPLREIEQMLPALEAQSRENQEDPRIKEMRKLVSSMNSDASSQGYDPREDHQILQEFKERIKSIPTSTPFLEEQKEQEKLAAEGGVSPQQEEQQPTGQLPLEAAPAESTSTDSSLAPEVS